MNAASLQAFGSSLMASKAARDIAMEDRIKAPAGKARYIGIVICAVTT